MKAQWIFSIVLAAYPVETTTVTVPITVTHGSAIQLTNMPILSCEGNKAGDVLATASLHGFGSVVPTWTIAPAVDVVIDPSTGVLSVGPNGLTPDICPSGNTLNETITATW